jgi:SSS family solute:Na+ symporter
VLQLIPSTKPFTEWVGPYYSGIAAYVFAAIGMIVGSLLKPKGVRA